MIGKLITHAADGKEAATQKSSLKNASATGSSEKVFKALLQSLQGEGSSDNQKLLTMAGSDEETESSKKQLSKTNVLGGNFSVTGTESESNEEGQLPKAAPTPNAPEQQLSENAPDNSDISQPNDQGEKSDAYKPANGGNIQKKTGEGELAEKQVRNTKTTAKDNSDSKTVPKDIVEDNAGKNVHQKKAGKTADKPAEIVKESGKKTVLLNNKEGQTSRVVSELPGDKTKQSGESVKYQDGNGQKKAVSNLTETAESNKDGEEKPSAAKKSSKSIGTGQKNIEPQSVQPEKSTAQEIKGDKAGEERSDKTESSRNVNNERASLFKDVKQKEGKGAKFLDGLRERQPKNPKKSAGSSVAQEQKQAVDSNTKDAKIQLSEKQQKLINNFFQNNTGGGISEKGFELKSMQVGKSSKKDKESAEKKSSSDRSKVPGDRLRMGMGRMGDASNSTSTAASDASNKPADNSAFTVDNQQIKWEQQVSKSAEGQEEKEANTNSATSATMRLGQMPISNISLRKNILPGITKNVLKATSGSKTPQQWQKHNFTLDDGKKVQLSVRETKGVLQVKMGSMNGDLSKLLQQNLQQIREHLRQEFDTDIDLQFENNEQENASEFSGDSSSSDSRKNYHDNFSNNKLTSENADRVTQNSVRNFGYNNMEWTA